MFNKVTSALMIGALALTTIATTPVMAGDRMGYRDRCLNEYGYH